MSERGANATILSANLAERSGLEPQPISQSTRLAGGACPMTVYFPWRRRMDSNPHRRGFAIRRIAILPRRLKIWWKRSELHRHILEFLISWVFT